VRGSLSLALRLGVDAVESESELEELRVLDAVDDVEG
jgi:hypothetical protein